MPNVNTKALLAEALDDLLMATAEGDRTAFRGLYDATRQRLFGMVMHLLRRRDLTEDVLQEGYFRIWSRAHSFDAARGGALAWMTCIMRNAAIDRLRQTRLGQEAGDFEDLDDFAETLPHTPVALDAAIDIARALETLTDQQRAAIVLMYTHGLTCHEIAERMGAPLGTVKSWIRRGAGRLYLHFQRNSAAQAMAATCEAETC